MQAYGNYQQAVMLLAKFGFKASEVWAMSHLEVQSWIQAYLLHQGIKKPQGKVKFDPKTTIISTRKPKQQVSNEKE